MSTEVKICGLSTPDTMAAALEAGAEFVGLVFFAKSPRHVSLQDAAALANLARGRALVTALTVDATDADLATIVAAIKPDRLQLHGSETPERCVAVQHMHAIPIIKAIGISNPADVEAARAYVPAVERILLDAKPPQDAVLPGGNGAPFDWSIISGLGEIFPFMLSGGLTPDNVAEAIRQTGARAVDVSSGVETAPGVKSAELIRAFVAAARTA
jgi:phosphoribosylanthranilate isomerase